MKTEPNILFSCVGRHADIRSKNTSKAQISLRTLDFYYAWNCIWIVAKILIVLDIVQLITGRNSFQP